MRAAVVQVCGEPPRAQDRPDPLPGPGTELVDVVAAPLTPLDLLCAGGQSYFGAPATPYVPGVQGVGRVGERLVWFATGAGMRAGDGSMAELAAVAAGDVVELPDDVDPVAVAAAGLSAVAALAAVSWRGGLEPGEVVVVLGAGGVVGQAAVQFARAGGAGCVVAGVRSAAARERAFAAGADVVVMLDRPSEEMTRDFAAAVGDGADLVVDPLFGEPAAAAAKVLRPGGRLVNLGASAGETSPLDSSTIRSRSLNVLGYTNNELSVAERASAIRLVAAAVADGSLAVTHETVPLGDVEDAWRRQARGEASGRIVLTT